jgi:hypothetical protein
MSRFKDISDNITSTDHDCNSKTLKLHYKCEPDSRCIRNIISYLRSTDWKDYRFNEYSVKKNNCDFVITFGYVVPQKMVFSK